MMLVVGTYSPPTRFPRSKRKARREEFLLKVGLKVKLTVFVCRLLPTNKNMFLCVLCDSVVKEENLSLFSPLSFR